VFVPAATGTVFSKFNQKAYHITPIAGVMSINGLGVYEMANSANSSCPKFCLSFQSELLPVDGTVTGPEYKASFLNENVDLPELMLRYLIYLVTSDESHDKVRNFALQSRSELNSRGIERLRLAARELANIDE
jgi:hypothetical protein